MEQQSASEYCPRCQVVQSTFQFTEDGVLLRRCQSCGFPVETGLTLEAASDTDQAGAREIKILCVDDDPLILQMLGDILRFRGYTVVTAPDGETGLEAAGRERPRMPTGPHRSASSPILRGRARRRRWPRRGTSAPTRARRRAVGSSA